MPARVRPIPPELWERLAALDHRCDFHFERTSVSPPGHKLESGRNYKRYWIVRVIEPARPNQVLTVEAPSLAMALAGAVESAERGSQG